jgi:hypothetical protein
VGHLAVAPTMADVALDERSVPGANSRTGAQLAFGLQPVLEIAPVRGAAREEQLIRAGGDVGVGQG